MNIIEFLTWASLVYMIILVVGVIDAHCKFALARFIVSRLRRLWFLLYVGNK